MNQNGLVQVGTFLVSSDAHILRGLLEAEDIKVFIFDELFSSNSIGNPSVLGGIKVFVPFKDLEKAKKITNEYYKNIEK
jgi:hypothetical protein